MCVQTTTKTNNMASGESDLKVIRCTYFELKQLAGELGKPQVKQKRRERNTLSNSVKKPAESSRSETEIKKNDGASSSEERKVSRQQKTLPDQTQTEKDMHVKKASRSSKTKAVAAKAGSREPTRNGLLMKRDRPAQITPRKTVRFEADDTKGSSDSDVERSEYDRGFVSPNRLLYDPASDKDIQLSGNARSVVSQQDQGSNDELCDRIGQLKINNSKRSTRTKNTGDLKDSPTSPHTQTDHRKSNKKLAETLLADINYLESDLDNLLSRRINSKEQLTRVMKLSHNVQEKCKSVLLADLYMFTTREVYHTLWRSGIYQAIEKLRELQRSSQTDGENDENWTSEITSVLQEFLDSTSSFINGLITNLEEKSDYSLKSYLDAPNQFENCSRSVKMALRSCHHFMIFLGDIERYKQNLLSTKDWSVARSYYLKASKIAPRNGKPYNQLAVIAVYAKRRLDAVYYYVRSLAVSNPIMTAREKLHAIFDDVQRKAYELHMSVEMEKERLAQEYEHNAPRTHPGSLRPHQNWRRGPHRHNSSSLSSVHDKKTMEEGRHELWVFYQNGSRREFLFTPTGLLKGQQNEKEINEKKEKPSAKISLNEINKQFQIFFLYCHAMLYSKIGIDHFSENHHKMLGLFRTLLRHPASAAVRMKRLVEIMAINMFEIGNLVHEDFGQFIEGTPLDLAVNLGCDMFQCLCKATCDVIKASGNSSDLDACHVVLISYVPAIKVWFDWLQKDVSLLRSSSVSIKDEFWNTVALFLNNLIEICALENSSNITPGDLVVTLPEDDHLNGFKHLAQTSKPRTNIDSASEKEMACGRLRTEAIHAMAKFLCEFEDLPLRFDVDSQRYYVTAIMANTRVEESQENENEIDEEDIDDDVIVESVEEFDLDSEMPSPVRELKAKKDALTKEILNQKQREEEARAVLVEHSSKPTLVLEVSPQYLVPDTNCFIDHLSGLQYIAEARYFTMVIPLVVINELDGLAKGFSSSETDQQQRAVFVASQARAAVDFLEYRFSLSDSQMLALTSKGSVLTTIAFRSEEPTAGRGINDDVILNCCTRYCDAKMDVVNKLATAEQPFTIRRKVVLLTEDRNLRLKAHVQNIPVVTVPQFLEMIVP